eukprot:UN13058
MTQPLFINIMINLFSLLNSLFSIPSHIDPVVFHKLQLSLIEFLATMRLMQTP